MEKDVYVGLDVHKATVAVAIAPGDDRARFDTMDQFLIAQDQWLIWRGSSRENIPVAALLFAMRLVLADTALRAN